MTLAARAARCVRLPAAPFATAENARRVCRRRARARHRRGGLPNRSPYAFTSDRQPQRTSPGAVRAAMDPLAGVRRHADAHPRHHRGERRAAEHGADAPHTVDRPRVGGGCLCPCAGLAAAHRRVGGRPHRTPARLHRRHGRLHRGVARVLAGLVARAADRRSRRAGYRRRLSLRQRLGTDRPRVPRCRARPRARRVGRGHRRRTGHRPAGRGPAHRCLRLAVDLPRQHPAGDRHHRPRLLAAPGVGVAASQAARLARVRHLRAGTSAPRVRPRRGEPTRLVQLADRLRVRRGGDIGVVWVWTARRDDALFDVGSSATVASSSPPSR